MMVVLFWLFACTPGSSVDTAGENPPDLPQVEIPTLRPQWDVVGMQAAVDDALRDGFPRLDEGIDVYLEMFENGDEDCPGGVDFVAIENLNGCIAESGFFFSGTSSYTNSSTEEDGFSERKQRVHGDFLLRDDQGQRLEVGGHIKLSRSHEDGQYSRKTEFEGSWRWDGHSAWLSETASGLLEILVRWDQTDVSLRLDGALQFYGYHWFMDALRIESTDECDWSVTGELSIRDPGGGWFVANFGGECDPCAVSIFEETETIGDLCLPLDVMMGPALESREVR